MQQMQAMAAMGADLLYRTAGVSFERYETQGAQHTLPHFLLLRSVPAHRTQALQTASPPYCLKRTKSLQLVPNHV